MSSQSLPARNITLLLASTMTVMAGATIAPALPAMEKAFASVAHSEFLVKMVLAVPGLMIAIGAPLVGLLLDRWKKKKLLIGAAIAYGVTGVAGCFLEGSLYGLLISRILLGLAVAGVMVTCTTLVADYFQGLERSRYMGLMAAFGGFGGVAFVALGGVLAEWHWTAPFALYGLAFLVLPALLLFIHEPVIHEPVIHNPSAQPGQGNTHSADSSSPGKLTQLCYALAVVELLLLYMVPVHLPFYAPELGIHSGVQAGMAIALMLLVMSMTSVWYHRVQAKLSFPVLHGAGLLLLALGYGILGSVSSVTAALLALAISGVGLGLMRPNVVIWLLSVTPPALRGRVMGGLTTCFFVGQFICPLLTQPVVQTAGYANLFQWAGVLVLSITAIALAGRYVYQLFYRAEPLTR